MALALKPPYKNPNNMWLTKSLFWDLWKIMSIEEKKYDPVFSLYKDKPGLVNVRKTFVDLGDATGYLWAIKYLGDYEHWMTLMKCRWFKEAYDVWIHELNQKLKAEAIGRIQMIAAGDTVQALAAAKFLAEQSGTETKLRRGRPTKEEIAAELKHEVRQATMEDEDLERIGLKVITGGKA